MDSFDMGTAYPPPGSYAQDDTNNQDMIAHVKRIEKESASKFNKYTQKKKKYQKYVKKIRRLCHFTSCLSIATIIYRHELSVGEIGIAFSKLILLVSECVSIFTVTMNGNFELKKKKITDKGKKSYEISLYSKSLLSSYGNKISPGDYQNFLKMLNTA